MDRLTYLCFSALLWADHSSALFAPVFHLGNVTMGHRPTKKPNYTSNNIFPKMVFVILGSSYHNGGCLCVHFSYKFGLN